MKPDEFEVIKHHLVKNEPETDEYSIIDNIEYKKQRKGIDEYITLVKKGRTRKTKVIRVNSEIIEVQEKIDGKEVNKQYFTHVPPVHEYDDTIRTNREKIMHFAYEDEPMTRDWWSMIIADHSKKYEKLLEIGCIIRDNNLEELKRYFLTYNDEYDGSENSEEWIFSEENIKEKLWNKSPTGYIFIPDWAGYDVFGKPRLVYDVSDIDAIKEEIYKVLEDNVIKEYSEAVIVDPYAKKNKELAFMVIVFAIVLILSDGMLLYFLTK